MSKRHKDEGQGPSQGPSNPKKRSCSTAENFMWTPSCRQNSIVLEFEPGEREYWEDDYPKDDYPTKVTFHSPGEPLAYQMLNGANDQTDVILQLGKLNDFDWTQTYELWSSLKDLLSRSNFRRSAIRTDKRRWTSTEEITIKDGPMMNVWPLLKLAFASDFINGDIKQCLHEILELAIDRCGASDLKVVLPFPTSSTNSRVLEESDTLPPDDVQSLHSSVLSFPRENRGIVVPDVIIHHKVKPLFVLNVECKRSGDRFGAGVLQCVKQMLSQMHWQELHFGFFLSPLNWQIIVMRKQQDGIELWQQRFQLFCTDQEDPDFYKFDVASFINFLDWICRIISFRSPRKADSKTSRQSPHKADPKTSHKE